MKNDVPMFMKKQIRKMIQENDSNNDKTQEISSIDWCIKMNGRKCKQRYQDVNLENWSPIQHNQMKIKQFLFIISMDSLKMEYKNNGAVNIVLLGPK